MTDRKDKTTTQRLVYDARPTSSAGVWNISVDPQDNYSLKVGTGEDVDNTTFKFPRQAGSTGQVLTLAANGETQWAAGGGGGGLTEHGLADVVYHSSSTLAELNSKISDATLIDTTDSRLSDARTPTAHSLGGSEHTTTTLAGLNAKISDATLYEWENDLGGTQVHANNIPDGADATAIHDNVAAEISAITEKSTLVGGDVFIIEDSAAGNAKKKVLAGNITGSGGNVSSTGTPVDNQLAVWTDATTIEGDPNLTFDGTTFEVTGNAEITGSLSVPGTGTNSEHFGADSHANGTEGVAIGAQATANATGGTSLGFSANADSTSATTVGNKSSAGANGTAVGSTANAGTNSVSIGTANQTNGGSQSVAIGAVASANHNNAVAVGYNMDTTANNQILVGSAVGGPWDAYLGGGIQNATYDTDITLQPAGGSGTDDPGGSFNIAGGKGTGTGSGGYVRLQTAPSGTTGTSLNPLVSRLIVEPEGLVNITSDLHITGSVSGSTVTASSGILVNDGQILAPNGGAAAPGFAFKDRTSTGMYRVGDDLAFSRNGSLKFYSTNTAFKVGQNLEPGSDSIRDLGSSTVKWNNLYINETLLTESSASPPSATAGFGTLYVTASDGHIYFKDSSGNEFDLTSTGSGGGGNVSNTGTPVNNQLAVWTNDTTIEGDANLTFDGSIMAITGGLEVNGTLSASTGLQTDGRLRTGAGSAAAPAIAENGGSTGFSFSGADIIVSRAGSEQYRFDTGHMSGERFRVTSGTTAGAPGFSKTTDTGTGLFFPTAGSLGLSVGGIEAYEIVSGSTHQHHVTGNLNVQNSISGSTITASSGIIVNDGQILVPTGDISAPGIAAKDHTNYGIVLDNPNIEFVIGGLTRFTIGSAANTTHRNLLPESDSFRDLGSTTLNFANLYVNKILNADESTPVTISNIDNDGSAVLLSSDLDVTGNVQVTGSISGSTITASSGIIVNDGQILAPNGVGSAPSYAFQNDPDTGMYFVTTRLRLNRAGVSHIELVNGPATQFNTDVYPNTDGTRDLGTTSLPWGNYYGNKLILSESSASPPSATAGFGTLYVTASDGHVYFKDSAGNEFDLTSTGSGGGGGGNVSNTGTPVNNQLAVWTDATTIEGDPNITWNGTDLQITGNIGTDGDILLGTSVSDQFLVNRSFLVTTPHIAAVADSDTGFAFRAVNQWTFIVSGQERFRFRADGLRSETTDGFQLNTAAGSATTPTYTFQSDLDTGMYRDNADQLAFAVGGVDALRIVSGSTHEHHVTGNLNVSSRIFADAGTQAAPSISFDVDPNTGFYRWADNRLGVTTNGTIKFSFGESAHSTYSDILPSSTNAKDLGRTDLAFAEIWVNQLQGGSGNPVYIPKIDGHGNEIQISASVGITGSLDVPGSGSNTLNVGKNAQAELPRSTSIGVNSYAFGTGSTAVGYAAATSEHDVAIGDTALSSVSSSAIGEASQAYLGSVAVGYGAKANELGSNNGRAIAIGHGAEAQQDDNIVIGYGLVSSVADRVLIGSSQMAQADVYFGNGVSAAPVPAIVQPSSAGVSSNIAGANMTIGGGKSTGNANGGEIYLAITDPGASGLTINSHDTKVSVRSSGDVDFSGSINVTGNVMVGELAAGPDSGVSLHVHKASAGTVDSFTDSTVTLENNGSNRLQFLTPNANEAAIMFGCPTSNSHASITYFGPSDSPASSMIFKVNNGLNAMKINSDQGVLIGPNFSSTLTADTALHVYNASAGSVSANADSYFTIENNGNTFMNFLAPNNAPSGILFGCPTSNAHGGILYFGPTDSPASTMQFRTGNNVTQMQLNGSGDLGIGVSPSSKLHIKQDTSSDYQGIRIEDFNTTNRWDIYYDDASDALYFNYNGGVNGGYLLETTNVANIDFTGQHRSMPSSNTSWSELSSSIGFIVVSSGEYSLQSGSSEIGINEAIPTVELSSVSKDKRVFGVISDSEESGSTVREYQLGSWASTLESSEEDNRLMINSLGEGAIWVCNISGNLENGDYITTCEIPGYGSKQDDDLLHNYTVAKITMNCDFDLSGSYTCQEFEFSGSTYRRAFVGCTYHCG